MNITNIQQYPINNQIKAKELRVIDDSGENLGVITLEQALDLAKEKNLDLIEIAPGAKPPVARIISYDKFRYQKEKELKKQRQGQKTIELKHIRISARAGRNDLEIKIRQLEEFLEENHKVEIQLFLKGREKGNKEWALFKLQEFLKMINKNYEITMEPRFIGRGYVVQIIKK
ncbi:MAG: translation initiation factor IF-3 [Candidatus Brennerbacteria bacterium]|nr:translation initiation factor IF-3 [Candidatus Brennerbacteria bacterium]